MQRSEAAKVILQIGRELRETCGHAHARQWVGALAHHVATGFIVDIENPQPAQETKPQVKRESEQGVLF